jgi:hypothetical protein
LKDRRTLAAPRRCRAWRSSTDTARATGRHRRCIGEYRTGPSAPKPQPCDDYAAGEFIAGTRVAAPYFPLRPRCYPRSQPGCVAVIRARLSFEISFPRVYRLRRAAFDHRRNGERMARLQVCRLEVAGHSNSEPKRNLERTTVSVKARKVPTS